MRLGMYSGRWRGAAALATTRTGAAAPTKRYRRAVSITAHQACRAGRTGMRAEVPGCALAGIYCLPPYLAVACKPGPLLLAAGSTAPVAAGGRRRLPLPLAASHKQCRPAAPAHHPINLLNCDTSTIQCRSRPNQPKGTPSLTAMAQPLHAAPPRCRPAAYNARLHHTAAGHGCGVAFRPQGSRWERVGWAALWASTRAPAFGFGLPLERQSRIARQIAP